VVDFASNAALVRSERQAMIAGLLDIGEGQFAIFIRKHR
jgi:hypothetical protein